MRFGARPNVPAQELGAGFLFARQADGREAVAIPALQDAGVTAIMSTARLDARDPEAVSAWMSAWGIETSGGLQTINQVHGSATVEAPLPLAEPPPDADAVWTRQTRLPLGVKAADCAPVWIVDSKSRRLAMVHAGWRGLASGVIESAFAAITAQRALDEYSQLMVAVGPHLRSCCFEVGPEVAGRFSQYARGILPATTLQVPRRRNDSSALDMSAVIRAKLQALKVAEDSIFISSACTRCNPELFHSYRRNGTGGPLMMAVGQIVT